MSSHSEDVSSLTKFLLSNSSLMVLVFLLTLILVSNNQLSKSMLSHIVLSVGKFSWAESYSAECYKISFN